MSHFTLLVLMEDKEDVDLAGMLSPYDENLECELTINQTRENFIKSTRNDFKEKPEIYNLSDDDFIQAMRDTEEYTLDEEGNELTDYNVKAKWDWWTVGGRWSDTLKLTEEAYELFKAGQDDENPIVYSNTGVKSGFCNAAKIKYLDFSPNPKVYASSLRFWDMFVEGIAKPENEDEEYQMKWAKYKPEYYKNRFGTKENYAELEANFTTWAVLTPDKKWSEKGNMGWFGMSNETHEAATAWARDYKKKFIETADPEWVAVVVDCHI